MEQRLQRLAAVNEAGRAMSAILDLDHLLERILSLADQVFHFANAAVLMLDSTANELFILKARGYDPEIVRSFRAGPGQGITGSVLVEGKPIFVRDVRQDDRYIRGVVGAHSEIAAPLVVDEMVIGVLDAETSEPRSFSQEDLDFFMLFAHQAATAIHNAQLHYEVALHAKVLEHRLEQLGALLAAGQYLVDGTPQAETQAAILATLAEVTSCDTCSVLLRQDSKQLQEVQRWGPPLFEAATFSADPFNGTICRVLAEGIPINIPNLLHEPEPYAGFPTTGCELVAPLLRAGRILGVLVGFRSVGDEPSEMDLAIFSGFANLLALSLEPAIEKV